MPLRLLVSFITYITEKIRAILKQIDRREEEEEQQNGMERGAIIQYRDEIELGVEEQQDKERIWEYLPEELVIESILTKLPARTLAICCCVSKLWCNSILNDSRFSAIHYIQNKHKSSLVFNLLNGGSNVVYFFGILGRDKGDIRIRFLCGLHNKNTNELVGYCNGLACVKIVSAFNNDAYGLITVVNPTRGETLSLSYFTPTEGYIYLCHGFGFDALSQVYKAVIVFVSKANNEFLCMVTTLGTNSWRKIVTNTFDLYASWVVTRVNRMLYRPATFCGGDLFWRTQNQVGNDNDKIDMLLSFDLHNEKIRLIRLPTECTQTTTTTNERQYLVVDQLLEFKGYPCIARSEGVPTSNNDHCCHHCYYQSTGVCCCCYKVHMYILKDKDKQVWTREETFDVQIMDQEGLPPTPLCWYFDTSAAMPPTRILTFSDQVLFYWFKGAHLILYSLQEKHIKVVECFRPYLKVFQIKMNEDLDCRIGDDDNISSPSVGYQLHDQVNSIVSLKTFIPKGANIIKTYCADEVRLLLSNNLAAGWMMTGRQTASYYVFS